MTDSCSRSVYESQPSSSSTTPWQCQEAAVFPNLSSRLLVWPSFLHLCALRPSLFPFRSHTNRVFPNYFYSLSHVISNCTVVFGDLGLAARPPSCPSARLLTPLPVSYLRRACVPVDPAIMRDTSLVRRGVWPLPRACWTFRWGRRHLAPSTQTSCDHQRDTCSKRRERPPPRHMMPRSGQRVSPGWDWDRTVQRGIASPSP